MARPYPHTSRSGNMGLMRFYLSLYQSDDRNIMDDQNNGIMNFLKEDVTFATRS
jgi:hypothetical protein